MDKFQRDNDDQIEDIEIAGEAPHSPFGLIANSIGTRNLMIAIITMPLVFIVVVTGIIAIFGKPDGADAQVAVRSTTVNAEIAAAPVANSRERATGRLIEPARASVSSGSALILPDGAVPKSMALDGDRLAIWIDDPDGAMIVVYDLATGAIIKTAPVINSRSAMMIAPVEPIDESGDGATESAFAEILGNNVDTELSDDNIETGLRAPQLAAHRRGDDN